MITDIDWTTVASFATAIAVLLAAWQLRRSAIQARTDFEDDLAREYRELSRSIPPARHLDRETTDPEFERAFPALFHYVDLSNEQVFLRMNGRISKATWFNWRDGIRANLQRRAFRRAWEEIKSGTTSFAELRRLDEEQFQADPRSWQPMFKRFLR